MKKVEVVLLMCLPGIIRRKCKSAWMRFWMHFAGPGTLGRFATRLASWFAPPYYARCYLAHFNPKGYVSPSATIYHTNVKLGTNIFIGDRVMIFQDRDGGSVEIGTCAHIHVDTFIETGDGGSVKIGTNTHIQPRCQLSAYKGSIIIGCGVQIAPNCAFYPYNHGFTPHELIIKQPLNTKGDIIIEDDVWLGFGVIVLDGVRIGKGSVIGAGAVVTHDIPGGSVAAGIPAKVLRVRNNLIEGANQRCVE